MILSTTTGGILGIADQLLYELYVLYHGPQLGSAALAAIIHVSQEEIIDATDFILDQCPKFLIPAPGEGESEIILKKSAGVEREIMLFLQAGGCSRYSADPDETILGLKQSAAWMSRRNMIYNNQKKHILRVIGRVIAITILLSIIFILFRVI